MRACVVARVIDTMYQLIYSSAQTQAWRIEFSYGNIDLFWTSYMYSCMYYRGFKRKPVA